MIKSMLVLILVGSYVLGEPCRTLTRIKNDPISHNLLRTQLNVYLNNKQFREIVTGESQESLPHHKLSQSFSEVLNSVDLKKESILLTVDINRPDGRFYDPYYITRAGIRSGRSYLRFKGERIENTNEVVLLLGDPILSCET